MLSKLRRVLVLGCVALAAAACGGSVVEVEAEDAGADSTSLPPAQTPAVESDGGISPEEQEADDLALLAASELTISGEASASAVLDEPFGVDVEVSVASSVGLVSVDFVLPDGVLLVGGDCGQGSGTLRCFVADELSQEDPAELAVELVLDSRAGFVAGDVVVVEAIATNSLSEFELNELTELTPEDNVITFEIVVA